MQNSGACGPLSDGVKKTIVGGLKPARPEPKMAPKASGHRRGGFAKHAKRGGK